MAITPHKDMMLHRDEAFSFNECYDACSEDRQKFYITGAWWQGSHKKQFKNRPKPEFNKLWRPINRIIGDINDMELNAKIVSNSDKATDEGAELLQKRWRNDFNSSDGVEASENANSESIIGGFGCVKVVSRYEDEESPEDDAQYLSLDIIHDASNSVRFGVESIRKDKSDALRGWHLIKGNLKALQKQFNVDKIVSFPNESPGYYNIERYDQQKDTYLAHYYEVIESNLTEYDFSAMAPIKITTGDGIKSEDGKTYTRDELKKMRQLYTDEMGEDAPSRRYKKKYVMYALADGEKYLTKPQKMPFKRIPLIPRYAYYTILEGQEYFCGEVRKQIDHEMFHNYFGSALMQIMAKPQVGKPEYLREQIAKHAQQRARDDIDNLPFLVSDPVKDSSGNITHAGPVGLHQPPQVGSGLMAAGGFLEQNLLQMSGTGQATLPANSSGSAVEQVNERQDDAFLPVVKNILHSIKGACECWIPAAQSLYFSQQRKLRVLEPDGNYTQLSTMEMQQSESGEYGPFGNTTPGRYAVSVEEGESYKDARNAERDSNLEMLQYVGTDTELGQLIAMSSITLTNGEGGGRVRRVAKYRMIDIMMQMGMPFEPENEEEEQYIQAKIQQQAAQQPQQDPGLALAAAEQTKADAAVIEAQVKQGSQQIDAYNAETKRLELEIKNAEIQIKAAELGVNIEKKQAETMKIRVDTEGSQIDSMKKIYG